MRAGKGREAFLATIARSRKSQVASRRPVQEGSQVVVASHGHKSHVGSGTWDLGPETWGLVRRMGTELEKVGGHLHCTATAEEACQLIVGLACARGVRRAVVCKSSSLEGMGLEGALREAGIAVAGPDLRSEALRLTMIEADMGISGVDYAIAETGTLVLAAGPGVPRNATALPPIHVAVLRPERLVPTLEAAVVLLKQGLLSEDGTWASSCVTFITGPSRTADIEQSLTIGVHGPAEVHVVVI